LPSKGDELIPDLMHKLFSLIFFLFPLVCCSQIPAGFPVINKTDLSDAKFTPARYFTGESLFGYMDGGAELYREYGISDAVITEFDLSGGHYKCEVFKMTGAEEAFGIYSVSKYHCLGSPPFSTYTCQTHYQLQICKGPYYISIINKAGNKADSIASLKIGEILSGKINGPSIDLTSFIPGTDTSYLQRNAVLAKGKLGLMNGATAWEDYFKDLSGFCALILPSGDKTILSVRFSDKEALMEFCRLHKIEPARLSGMPLKISGSESVTLLRENHLLIRSGF
jgi:hypothetical protein